MFETAGNLTIVELASSLTALVLLPLLWAAVAAFSAVRGTGARLAVRAAIALAGGTLGLAIVHAVRAARTPSGHVAQQHVARIVRIGQLDLGLDLVRDPTSAALTLLVAVVAFAAVLHTVWSRPAGVLARLAWMGLATSAALVVVLADDLPALAVGLQIATIAAWGLGGGGRARALGLALGGDVAVVLAAWILFWSLGGNFGASGYTPDAQPRFAVALLPEGSCVGCGALARPEGKATVSLTTYDDALVSSDDGPPLPGEPLRSPFTLTLEPGVYSFRIQAGASTSDLLVTHVALAPGRDYVLTPYGPTASFLNLGDQLAVPRPTLGGPSSLRAVLASRALAGLGVTTVVALVLVLAMLLRLALLADASAVSQARSGLIYGIDAVAPVVLMLRIAPLFDPRAASVLAVLPSLAAVVFASGAASSPLRDRTPRAALAALAALALSSVLLGETAGALVLVVTAVLSAVAITAVLETNSDVRWLGVACAGVSGILPGAGASPGIISALIGALSAGASGRGASTVVVPLIMITAILLSLGALRVYFGALRLEATSGGGASAANQAGTRIATLGTRILIVFLAAASLLGGAALGVGSSPFGGRAAPLARRLVSASGGVDGVPRLAVAALTLSLAAAVVGLLAARHASRAPETPDWERRGERSEPTPDWVILLGAPTQLLRWVGSGGARLVRFFVKSVEIMNEDVIDDATDVLASGVAAAFAGLRVIDAKIGRGLVARTLGRADDPGKSERLRFGLLLGMVALLTLVVLSSVVLG